MTGQAGRLVVCGTPIGNLGDVSPRLAAALADADLVACEDTRQTGKLLAHLGVRARTVSYHEANERSRAAELAGERRTMVFFEAPHRVLATLAAMAEAFGPGRPAAVARELTKLHEEVLRGPLAELAARLEAQGPRGELTLVVGGAPERAADAAGLVAEVERLVGEGATTKDAVGAVATRAGAPRRALYQAVLDARSAAPAPARRPGASLPTGGSLAGTVLPAPPSRSSGSLESP